MPPQCESLKGGMSCSQSLPLVALTYFISGVLVYRTMAARVENRTWGPVVRNRLGHSIRDMILPF